jgi:hypothetical protein
MKVKDIMKKAASLLGNADGLMDYLNGDGFEGAQRAELLLNCFNFVENELALDYFPLIKKEDFVPQGGRILYSQLSSSPVRILDVENADGEKVAFQVFATYLEVDVSPASVRYAYAPLPKTMEGQSDYGLAASERLLAFGMAAEYLAALGLLEEASVWDKKYKEGIQAALEWEQKCEEEMKKLLQAEEKEPTQEKEPEKETETKPFGTSAGTMPSRWWV